MTQNSKFKIAFKVSRFLIKQDNPFKYKDQILKFWQDNLPDTPPGRLEWMMNGNPAGPSKWFFAFESKSGDLAGMISVMPKDLMLRGKQILAGIMGDLVVGQRYRVFGPALSLVKSVIKSMADFGFDFIYTIPNPDSRKLMERAGFEVLGELVHMLKPLDLKYYFQKYGSALLSYLPSSCLRFVVKALSRETYVSSGKPYEADSINEEFDILCQDIERHKQQITAHRNSAYLKWRFLDNPAGGFRVLVHRDKSNNGLSGYLVYKVEDRRIHLYDIFCKDEISVLSLISMLTHIGFRDNCIGIYIRLLEQNPLLPLLRKCRFIDTRDKATVFMYSNKPIDISGWDFFSGDRNI